MPKLNTYELKSSVDENLQVLGIIPGNGAEFETVRVSQVALCNFTSAEKAKLAGLESSHFKGMYVSLAALEIAHPTGSAGDYADVDPGAGSAVRRFIWDVSDSQWQQQAGSGGSMTAAEVKSAYESNPDTNVYTDAEQTKLAGVAAGATANANTDSLAEGAANKYFTESRVRSAVLTGLSLLTGGAIAAADTLLVALGKLQAQITGLSTSKLDANANAVSATKLATARTIALTGDVAGSANFDGSADVSINAQVADDSHTHSLGNLGLGNAATRTALGTTGALYSRDSILGTVSKSAGIPTGAIIERGSNANGDYVRFADGTQICSGRLSGGLGSATAHGSSLYYYLKLLTWPASFSGSPTLSGYGFDNMNMGTTGGYDLGLYSGQLVYITPTASVTDTNIGWTAIGRWY